jgi:hypothetical protein
MTYFKSALIGLGSVLLGCVVTPIAMLIWASWRTESGEISIGFSPMQLAHSVGFWVFIAVLFAAGFVPSVLFLRR